MLLQKNLSIRDRSYRLKVYKDCFVASEAVSLLLQLTDSSIARAAAVAVYQRLVDEKIICHVCDPSKRFADDYLFFRFVTESSAGTTNLESLLAAAKAEIKLRDVRQGKETVTNCFTGHSAIAWLSAREEIGRPEAEKMLQKLVDRGDIEAWADPSLPMTNDSTIFRFAEDGIPKLSESTETYNLFPASKLDTLLSANMNTVSCALCVQRCPIEAACPDLALLGALPSFDASHLTELEPLGSGSFAHVFRTSYLFGDGAGVQPAVLKQYDLGDTDLRAFNFAKLRLECWVLSECAACPNIVSLYGVAWTDGVLSVLLEMMKDGDLYNFIRRTESSAVSVRMRLSMAEQIAEGMRVLHNLSIIHNDLKSPNVLVSVEADSICAKICDFDQAQSVAYVDKLPRQWKVENPIWSPPESEHLSRKTDVFSFAIICWELSNWLEPYREVRFLAQIAALVAGGGRPQTTSNAVFPADAQRLIEDSWHPDPDKRPTFEQICHRLGQIRERLGDEGNAPTEYL